MTTCRGSVLVGGGRRWWRWLPAGRPTGPGRCGTGWTPARPRTSARTIGCTWPPRRPGGAGGRGHTHTPYTHTHTHHIHATHIHIHATHTQHTHTHTQHTHTHTHSNTQHVSDAAGGRVASLLLAIPLLHRSLSLGFYYCFIAAFPCGSAARPRLLVMCCAPAAVYPRRILGRSKTRIRTQELK